ncbi:MAG: matrixin family metalloprotease [Candidatus Paceibacteria bacterium]
MKKQILSLGAALSLIMAVGPVLAMPNFDSYTLENPNKTLTLWLPEAAGNAPVISLGAGIDPESGQLVEGYAFIHYKDKKAKPPTAGKVGGAKCYGFLSKGAKWNWTEPWVVNAANSRGLAEAFVLGNLAGNIAKWEDAADGALDGITVDILGEGSATTSVLVADTETPDGQNEVYFADISSPGAIAVTIIWGIFSGPPSGRKLVEWDQVYDDFDHDWSSSGEAGKMDFENIATHELGHSVGMDDVYEVACSEVTMYGYADYGETKKRTLEVPDIVGVSTLY